MDLFDILSDYKKAFGSGLIVTLKLCLVVWSLGLFFGIVFGTLSAKYYKTIGRLLRIAGFVLSGIPIIVLLFWLHYPLQAMLNITIEPFLTASFALGIVNIIAVSEIVRNSISEVPTQFIEAAKVCGINKGDTLLKIEFPLVVRGALPMILTSQVNILHLTLFASLISVNEIFRVSQQINSLVYKPIEIYSALGAFFLLICLPLNGLAIYLKHKYTRDFSER